MFKWVKLFNPYDSHSKNPIPPNWTELRPYYEELVKKYFAGYLKILSYFKIGNKFFSSGITCPKNIEKYATEDLVMPWSLFFKSPTANLLHHGKIFPCA